MVVSVGVGLVRVHTASCGLLCVLNCPRLDFCSQDTASSRARQQVQTHKPWRPDVAASRALATANDTYLSASDDPHIDGSDGADTCCSFRFPWWFGLADVMKLLCVGPFGSAAYGKRAFCSHALLPAPHVARRAAHSILRSWPPDTNHTLYTCKSAVFISCVASGTQGTLPPLLSLVSSFVHHTLRSFPPEASSMLSCRTYDAPIDLFMRLRVS